MQNTEANEMAESADIIELTEPVEPSETAEPTEPPEPRQHISFVAYTAAAVVAAGCVAFALWMQGFHVNGNPSVLLWPFVSFFVFALAVCKTVPAIEKAWHVKPTQIDVTKPISAYILIAIFMVVMNLLFIVLGYMKIDAANQNAGPFEALKAFFDKRNDTPHYIDIAKQWYGNSGGDHRYVIVFFPLFPILIAGVALFGIGHMYAAILVANVFAFFCRRHDVQALRSAEQ